METKDISKLIEAILFYKNEPLSVAELSKILEIEKEKTLEAINMLGDELNERGITLIQNDGEVSLATSVTASNIIEKIAKDEMSSEISKAGLETLSIILYKGPLSRREIDYIRGVNSSFILRNLLIRGLIKKDTDSKQTKYKSSVELLAHLGISKIEELPEFEKINQSLQETEELEA